MKDKCIWTYDKEIGQWKIGCLPEHPYFYTTMRDKLDFKVCPYCGAEIEVKK